MRRSVDAPRRAALRDAVMTPAAASTTPLTLERCATMKVKELRDALDARELPSDGLKATLRARLEEFVRRGDGGGDDDDDAERASDAEASATASEGSTSESASVEDALARRIRASAQKAASAANDDGDGGSSDEGDDESEDEASSDEEEKREESESEESDSNGVEEDKWRRKDDPVLHELLSYYVARGVETACKLEAFRRRVEDPAFEPTAEEAAFVDELQTKLIEEFTQPLPTLESEAKAQRERRLKEEGGIDGSAPKARGDEKLSAMPTDGWNRTRKKERVKLKKNDPSAQGTYETRKLIEEGAGLFVAPNDKTKVRRELRKMERKTAGKGWFDMKAVEYTPELRREMRMLKLRGAYDPKRFYKNADTSRLPTHFQVGTVVGGAADFYSARLAKKDQKRTLAEEIMHDKDIEHVRRHRFAKIQEKNAGNMGRKAKRKLGGRERGNAHHKKKKI